MADNPNIPANHAPLQFPLVKLKARLDAREPAKIVTIGSSSVAGEFRKDIVPFPSRLEMHLRWTIPDQLIDVINHGKKGEDAPDQEKRLQTDVLDVKPDMVIWQAGTNAVWKESFTLKQVTEALDSGLQRLGPPETRSMDIMLMDSQYAPAILTADRIANAERMVGIIGELAQQHKVNVFRRFDLMRRWYEFEKISFDQMINPNDEARLHQSDWCTVRLTYALSSVILKAVGR